MRLYRHAMWYRNRVFDEESRVMVWRWEIWVYEQRYLTRRGASESARFYVHHAELRRGEPLVNEIHFAVHERELAWTRAKVVYLGEDKR